MQAQCRLAAPILASHVATARADRAGWFGARSKPFPEVCLDGERSGRLAVRARFSAESAARARVRPTHLGKGPFTPKAALERSSPNSDRILFASRRAQFGRCPRANAAMNWLRSPSTAR